MTSRVFAAVALALTVLLAGCLGGVQAQPAAATSASVSGPDGPSISVSASGQVEAEPDLAIVNVAVEARADTATAAREQVATAVAEMRQALRDASLDDSAVTTRSFSVQPEYDFGERERELVGYRAVHAFAIEVSDVSRAGEIVDVAVDGGATRVDNVQFTLAEDTRAELRAEALTLAMEQARTDADTLADASSLTVTGIHSASTGGGVSPIAGPVFAERDAMGGTTFEPGPVTVSAHVSVVYSASTN